MPCGEQRSAGVSVPLLQDATVDDAGAYALDTSRVRRAFDRAAKTYDAAAVLHAQVRGTLLARLELMALDPRVAVDAGAGTGHASHALKRRYPKALVIAVDTSQSMLQAARRQQSLLRRFSRVRADADFNRGGGPPRRQAVLWALGKERLPSAPLAR